MWCYIHRWILLLLVSDDSGLADWSKLTSLESLRSDLIKLLIRRDQGQPQKIDTLRIQGAEYSVSFLIFSNCARLSSALAFLPEAFSPLACWARAATALVAVAPLVPKETCVRAAIAGSQTDSVAAVLAHSGWAQRDC